MRDVLECARRKIVENGNAPSLRQTALRQMRSNKPGPASNQDVHAFLPTACPKFLFRSNSRYSASMFSTSVSLRYCRDARARPASPMRDTRVRSSASASRSEEHTSELQSPCNLVCRLLLE